MTIERFKYLHMHIILCAFAQKILGGEIDAMGRR
jgi:hypothetical protein